jgi:MFS family permease
MQFIVNALLYRNRNFRLLYVGQFLSFIGTMITGVALPYQIYQETHSTLLVGLLGLVQLLPILVTALIGGVFADRHHRRLLLVITESLLALGCLFLAWNAFLEVPHTWLIFVVASLMSAINGFHRPALDSITQQLVPKADFPSVGVLGSFKFSFGMIAGPAIGGLIIARFGVAITFLVDFFTFVLSLLLLLRIGSLPKPEGRRDQSTWVALKQGFQYALSRQELVGSYLVDFVAMIFGMPTALFPAIADAHGGAKVLGMLYSAPAVGALLVSFWGGWARYIRRYGAAIAFSAAFWGFAIIFFGLVENFYLALFFMGLAGAADAVSGIFRLTLWNETIPTEYRGRLAGIEMISYLSGPKLGDMEAGLVAAFFGVTASVVSGGVLCVGSVLLCSYFLPKFWQYRSKENA